MRETRQAMLPLALDGVGFSAGGRDILSGIDLVLEAGPRTVIFDVSGRRVRTLIPGVMTDAGIHKADWDGKNDNGKQLASGVYFARFVAEGQVSARKLILLR